MTNRAARILLLLLIITGITLAVIYGEAFDTNLLEVWMKDAEAAGPVLFMVIFALGTVFFLPGSVFTLAGGALFGPVLGNHHAT
jgi:uncharacterized membrane protein YdjX (TVP38/TMEM64 family)